MHASLVWLGSRSSNEMLAQSWHRPHVLDKDVVEARLVQLRQALCHLADITCSSKGWPAQEQDTFRGWRARAQKLWRTPPAVRVKGSSTN